MVRLAFILLAVHFAVPAWCLCVVKPIAELRAGPSGKAPKSWTVGKFMPLVQIGKKGEWLQVKDVDGQTHWAHRSWLSSKVSCAVVKSAYVSLRSKPGKGESKADFEIADRYSTFQKIDRDEAWVKLKDDFGGVYWAHENSLWFANKVQSYKF